MAGTGKSQYSGTVPVETTLSGGVYKMVDSTRGVGGVFGGTAITNLNHANSGPGTVYSASTNSWGDGANYNGGSTTSANGKEVIAVKRAYAAINVGADVTGG